MCLCDYMSTVEAAAPSLLLGETVLATLASLGVFTSNDSASKQLNAPHWSLILSFI